MSWVWKDDGVGNPNAPPGGPPPAAPNPGTPGLHNQDFKGVLGQRGGMASPGLMGLQQSAQAAPAGPPSPYAHVLGQMPAGVDMLRAAPPAPVTRYTPPPVPAGVAVPSTAASPFAPRPSPQPLGIAAATPLAGPSPSQGLGTALADQFKASGYGALTSDVRTKTNITPMSWEDYLRSRS